MMKKLMSILLVLAMTSVASAVVIDLGPVTGPGSAGDPAEASENVVIPVYGDGIMLTLDLVLDVDSGNGSLVGAVGTADAASYGWDTSLSFDPDVSATQAEFGMGNFGGNQNAPMGYFLLHCDGYGDVVVSLSLGTKFGGSGDSGFNPPTIGTGTITVHQIPEPMTVALLGLGGLALLRRRK
jgi:hypothetical protein